MYLARNSNGCLWLFAKKPIRVTQGDGGYWTTDGEKMQIELKGVLTWKDEPFPVGLEADLIRSI